MNIPFIKENKKTKQAASGGVIIIFFIILVLVAILTGGKSIRWSNIVNVLMQSTTIGLMAIGDH